MKKSIIFFVTIWIMVTSSIGYGFSGGTGVRNDPFQIATAEELVGIAGDYRLFDNHFVLISDIDLDPNTPASRVFDRAVINPDPDTLPEGVYGYFTGSFDGQGHTISGLTIDSDSGYVGLFHIIGEEGAVRRIHLVGGSVRGDASFSSRSGASSGTGSLVGVNHGLVEDCSSDVIVHGYEIVGGLVGNNYSGTVTGCYSTGRVSGERAVGGLGGG